MKYLIALIFALSMPVMAQTVTFTTSTQYIYFCLVEDRTVCALVTSNGDILTRSKPVGRDAIDYDMQNLQWATDNAQALQEGDERTSWLFDREYWNVRLLADKAWTMQAAAPVPPAWATKDTVRKYRKQFEQKAKEVLILELFGFPVHEPLNKP